MTFGGSTEQLDGQPSDLVMTRSSVLPPVCVECGQQLSQTVGVSISRVVDVDIEVAGDDHPTTKRSMQTD